MRKKKLSEEPIELELLEKELKREKHKHRYALVIKSTVYTLITVAAVAVLAGLLYLILRKGYQPKKGENLCGFAVDHM